MQLQVTDASASQTRNVFIDAVNETGAAVANQVGQIQSDGGSHWSWSTQPAGNRTDRRVERLRIDSDGQLCLTGTTTGVDTTPELNGFNAYYETDQGQVTLGSYSGGGATHIAFYTNEGGNPMTQKMCLQYDGRLGLGIDTPVAGDLKTGDAQNHPKFHIKGTAGAGTTFSDNSATGGEFNLLARFEAGGDADNTGAMIVLNHSNDRGLAIQGGRSNSNRSFGALKSIDNVGRLTNAMVIGGGNGHGVDYISFYTGNSTSTTARLRISSDGTLTKYYDSTSTPQFYLGGTSQVNGIGAIAAASQAPLVIGRDSGNNKSIHCSGNIQMASGYGIDFSATGDGNGTDSSELLDDYEEGSWTPNPHFATTGDAGENALADGGLQGQYVKIGRLVYYTFSINFTSRSNSASGNFYISGLPYNVTNTYWNEESGFPSAYYSGLTNVTGAPSTQPSHADKLYFAIPSSSSDHSSNTYLNHNHVGTGDIRIRGGGIYRTAS